MECFRISWSPG